MIDPVYTLNTMASPTVVTTPNSGTYISAPSSGGFVYTTNTTASPSWSDTIQLGNDSLTGAGVLQVKGDAEFEGEIKLKGKSLSDTLSKLEERLSILHPNEKLEEKWEKLSELRKEYMELEADIIEKEKIWSILKR